MSHVYQDVVTESPSLYNHSWKRVAIVPATVNKQEDEGRIYIILHACGF